MKIFITGTTGFIGHSLKDFYQSNNEIFEYVRGSDLYTAIEVAKPDVIINCAGEIYNASAMYRTNVDFVEVILEWVKRNPATKLIQIGSSAEYGPVHRATRETDPINPVDVYQATKGAATLLCQGYARQFDLSVSIARVYSAYGHYERPHRLFPRLYRAFYNNEPMMLYSGVHDFIYIDDFVRGIDMLVNAETEPGEIVNFGSGVQSTNLEIFDLWTNITGIDNPPVTYENRMNKKFESEVWCCDTGYSMLQYNYKPLFTLEQGIKDFIKKYASN